ncbi:MAG: uncharacterized protein KVP18_000860 [Porospora cf. gigantea A]|uniref:uncharacterized protein n=1 Tax=Porospora cf. gigantea A TaxID=2853593 RepID=UPI00355A7044|nr:MAG: hypothetical protein KVP18_000860 [Porospora cf. gigantea A]
MPEFEDDCCPLCMEPLDDAEREFYPCECDYQVCAWCFKQLRDNMNDSCPACRTTYDDSRFRYLKRPKAEKPVKEKPDIIHKVKRSVPAQQDLRNVRVIQRNLVYVVGLPVFLARKEILKQDQFLGQYGSILNIVVNKQTNPAVTTCSVYVTFARKESARAAIMDIDGILFHDKPLRAAYGTTKYCGFFIRGTKCTNPDCFYLHRLGDEEDRCYSKEDIVSAKPTHDNDEHRESSFGKLPTKLPRTLEPRKPPSSAVHTWAKIQRPAEISNDSNFPSLAVITSPTATKTAELQPTPPVVSSCTSESAPPKQVPKRRKPEQKHEEEAPAVGSPQPSLAANPVEKRPRSAGGVEVPQFFDLQGPASKDRSEGSSPPVPPPLSALFGPGYHMSGQSIRTNGSFQPEKTSGSVNESESQSRMAAWFVLLRAIRSDLQDVASGSIAAHRRNPDGQPVLSKLVSDLKAGMPIEHTLKSTQVIHTFGNLLRMRVDGGKEEFSSAVPLASGRNWFHFPNEANVRRLGEAARQPQSLHEFGDHDSSIVSIIDSLSKRRGQ